MVNLIKNIRLLSFLDEDQVMKLEHVALQHQRFSHISFKIEIMTDTQVTVTITQQKSTHQHPTKRLVEITNELFLSFIGERRLIVGAIPYVPSPVEIVTSEWIKQQMSRYRVALKQLAIDTGINKSSLSSVITGDKPLSDPMRAMFFYYFKNLA